jgi:hypothetical protein
VGWFVGLLIVFVLDGLIVVDVMRSGVLVGILAYSMLGAALGSVVSLLQWLVLRRRVSRAVWWVLASTAGFAVAGGGGCGAAVVAFGYSEVLKGLGSLAVLGWTVVVALGGAVTGILQWLVLRRHVSRAGWWVLASTVGCGLGMAVMGAFAVGGFVLAVGGAVLGAVTGGALVWLLRQPVPEV